MTRFLIVLALLVPVCASATEPAAAAAACTRGHVYDDRNGNGRFDRGDRPLAGIAVSDGRRIVRSGSDGAYDLPAAPGATAFVIKPAGYAFPSRADGLPDFWRNVPDPQAAPVRYGGLADATAGCRDFALQRDTRRAGRLHTLLFADPQTRDEREAGFYGRTVAAVRAASGQPDGRPVAQLGLTMGDIVNDTLSLYPVMNRHTASLRTPWLHAAGNHDIDFDVAHDEQSLASFRNTFGPDTFAWEEHEASFVVLDDVVYMPGQKPAYIGGLREDQFAFLEAWLPTLRADRRLVLAVHIPFFDEPGRETFRRADRERLFALLARFDKVLLLSGHGHVQRQHRHGPADGWHGAAPLHEFNLGAVCGSYWSGPNGRDGAPSSTMADGTPRGWADLWLDRDGGYSLRWNNATDEARDTGVALFAPKVLRRGAYPGSGVYANVFMGERGDTVEYRIDDGPWLPMTWWPGPDPRVLAENLRDADADGLRARDRIPEADIATHVWRGTLPTDLAAGDHRIEVRARDPWRGWLSATRVFRLQDEPAAP